MEQIGTNRTIPANKERKSEQIGRKQEQIGTNRGDPPPLPTPNWGIRLIPTLLTFSLLICEDFPVSLGFSPAIAVFLNSPASAVKTLQLLGKSGKGPKSSLFSKEKVNRVHLLLLLSIYRRGRGALHRGMLLLESSQKFSEMS